MKKYNFIKLVIFTLIISGCSNNKTTQTDTSFFDNNLEVILSEWSNFTDYTGELINYTNADIISINMNYAVGWTLDDPKPKKIRRDDIICGFEVDSARSTYHIKYGRAGKAYLDCVDNSFYCFSNLNKKIVLDGVLINVDNELNFYPYSDEELKDFPILLPYNDNFYNSYKEKSFIKINDDSIIEVQPIAILIENLFLTDEGDYFNATLEFNNIVFQTISHGEGEEPHSMVAYTDEGKIVNIELIT